MPIARITGSGAAKLEWLTERLRARGYDVQALAPGDSVDGPADLEIELATCLPEEALAQAEAFARSNPQVQILVAPGVLAEGASTAEPQSYARSIRWWQKWFSRTSALPSPARISEAQPILEAVDSAANVLPPVVLSNPANSEAMGTADSVSPSGVPAADPRHEFAAMIVDERSRWQSVLRRQEESRHAELAQLAQEAQQRDEQRQAREAEIARRNREAEVEVLRMASKAEQSAVAGATLPEASPPVSSPALNETISSSVPSAASDLVIDSAGGRQQIPSSSHDHTPPEPLPPQVAERASLSIPSALVAAQPATPEVQASPPQPVPPDSTLTKAPVRTPEFTPPEIGMMEVPIEVPVPVPSSAFPPGRTRRATRRAPAARSRRRQSRTLLRRGREWRIAVVTASLFTVVLMGAWSLATNPRPAAPLSLRQLQQSNSIQQDLPFGRVRITNQSTASTVQSPARVSVPPAAPVQLQSSASAKSQSARPAQSQPKPSVYRSRRTPPHDTQNAGDDEVVVRHILPTPRPQHSEPAQAKAGMRHISDLN